jgi:hypothetical protein
MNEPWYPRGARPEVAPLLQFGIESEIQRLKEEPAWRSRANGQHPRLEIDFVAG